MMGLATVGLGTVQVFFGVRSPLYAAANLPLFPILDSNLRFFGGMGLGLGLVLLWPLPSIERRTLLFRACFTGGQVRYPTIVVMLSNETINFARKNRAPDAAKRRRLFFFGIKQLPHILPIP